MLKGLRNFIDNLPVGRRWLELDPLDLLPSCLHQLDRVDLGDQVDRAYLGYHLCLVDLLDRLVRRCLVDPADLRFLKRQLNLPDSHGLLVGAELSYNYIFKIAYLRKHTV